MLKFSIKLIIVALLITAVVSCNKNNSSNPYTGQWSGEYTGQDEGTISVIISGSGKVTGTIRSSNFNQSFNLVGTVNTDGQITLTTGAATSGAEFAGNLKGNTGNGEWSNDFTTPALLGNWTAKKQ